MQAYCSLSRGVLFFRLGSCLGPHGNSRPSPASKEAEGVPRRPMAARERGVREIRHSFQTDLASRLPTRPFRFLNSPPFLPVHSTVRAKIAPIILLPSPSEIRTPLLCELKACAVSWLCAGERGKQGGPRHRQIIALLPASALPFSSPGLFLFLSFAFLPHLSCPMHKPAQLVLSRPFWLKIF